MTKATTIRLPKSTLVSFDPRSVLDSTRVVYWDRNDDGILGAGDVKFTIVDSPTSLSVSRKTSCIYGCASVFGQIRIYRHVLSSNDSRSYGRAFRKDFKREVDRAKSDRPWVKKMPAVVSGDCYAYWKRSFFPMPKRVSFLPRVTLSTRVRMGFGHRLLPRPTMNPAMCRAISAKATINVSRRRQAVLLTAGGGQDFPVWMIALFDSNLFKRKYPNAIGQVGVSYVYGKNRYIHLEIAPAKRRDVPRRIRTSSR